MPFRADSDAQLDELVNWLQDSFPFGSMQASIPIHSIGSCTDTEIEARRQIAPVQVAYHYLAQGRLQFLQPSPQEAVEMLRGVPIIGRYQRGGDLPPRCIAGTFEQVAEQLWDIQRDFLVDEFVIQDMTTDWSARQRSYELLAGLIGSAPAPTPSDKEATP